MRHLPADSALKRATGEWWDERLELAALHLEVLHDVLRATLGAAGVTDLPDALHVPRPHEPADEPDVEGLTLDEWRSFLEG